MRSVSIFKSAIVVSLIVIPTINLTKMSCNQYPARVAITDNRRKQLQQRSPIVPNSNGGRNRNSNNRSTTPYKPKQLTGKKDSNRPLHERISTLLPMGKQSPMPDKWTGDYFDKVPVQEMSPASKEKYYPGAPIPPPMDGIAPINECGEKATNREGITTYSVQCQTVHDFSVAEMSQMRQRLELKTSQYDEAKRIAYFQSERIRELEDELSALHEHMDQNALLEFDVVQAAVSSTHKDEVGN